jgi:hypothetical protein
MLHASCFMQCVPALLLVGLAHSIGWGIRGNFGHEYGAMIPGALSALALCIALPWSFLRERAALVGFAGAIGWSFGGSMSYGQLIGMTAADTLPHSAYGFAMLGVIGFLWALVGGAAVGLAVSRPVARVAAFVPPLLCVFVAWAALDAVTAFVPEANLDRLSWWDTDWLGVLVALLAIVAYREFARRDEAGGLMLWMAVGWWAGFLLLTVILGLHMTPPRSDNWAGSVGMGVALVAWLLRRHEREVLRAALVTGVAGGLGFMTGQGIANMGRAVVPDLNWWSVMEQSFGFIAGAGLLLAMRTLVARTPAPAEPPAPDADRDAAPAWTEGVAVGFLLLGVSWLNIRKNPAMWLRNGVVAERMGPFAIETWLLLAYLLIAIIVVLAVRAHLRRGLEVVPATPLGRAQMLFLGVLWVIVIGNLSRYLPFPEGRLVTEGVIHLNAVIVSGMGVLMPRLGEAGRRLDETPPT